MNIQDIIHEAAETLRETEYLARVPVVELDKGNASKDLEVAVAKAKVAILVSWNGFTPRIQGETALNQLVGETTIVVSVFERPIVNRVDAAASTLMNIAQAVANALHNAAAEGMDAPLFLKRISPISELAQSKDSSIVTCDVEFSTVTSL